MLRIVRSFSGPAIASRAVLPVVTRGFAGLVDSVKEAPEPPMFPREAPEPPVLKVDKESLQKRVATSPIAADDEENPTEEMWMDGPQGKEWGGPMRGGRFKEPTRFGDWERNGRCSDF